MQFHTSITQLIVRTVGFIFTMTALPAMSSEDESKHYQIIMDNKNITLSLAEHKGEYFVKSKIKAAIENTTVDQFKNVIFGLTTMPEWMGVKEANLINRIDNTQQRIELIKDMPFPLSDRQTVMIQKLAKMSDQRIRITLHSDYKGVPVNQKYQRVIPYKGEWIITQQGKDVQVELQQSYGAQLSTSLPRIAVVSNLKSDARSLVKGINGLKL